MKNNNVQHLGGVIFYLFSVFLSTIYSQEKVSDAMMLDSITHNFLTAVNTYEGDPLDSIPIADGRQLMRDIQLAYPVQQYAVDTIRKRVVVREKELELVIVTPKESKKKKFPVLMYFHGGGWVFGDEITHQRLIHQLAVQSDMAVVFVPYSCAPEVQYPEANEEAYAATKWIVANGDSLGLDVEKIAVGGDSAGGNMATVLALMAKERKELTIDFQLLFYPVIAADFNTKSYTKFHSNHYLTKRTMQWFFNQYAPDATVRNQSKVSPLCASIDQLSGLPPALIITAKYDVLSSEGEAYANKMSKAGVPVVWLQYNTIHDFVMLNALANTKASVAAITEASKHLKLIWKKSTPEN